MSRSKQKEKKKKTNTKTNESPESIDLGKSRTRKLKSKSQLFQKVVYGTGESWAAALESNLYCYLGSRAPCPN